MTATLSRSDWRAPVDVAEVTASEGSLRTFLHGLPGVDQVGVESRVAKLATRSVKAGSKTQAIDLAIAMIDLTTLEGRDTPATVRSLCARARRPDPQQPDVPSPAAVCLYPDLVPVARDALAGTPIAIASVATGFPSGRTSLAIKLAETADAVAAGADEVDMVIDRARSWLGGTAKCTTRSSRCARPASARTVPPPTSR